ncbi:MAG: cation diffusion facilitator family transporter [Nannocystaceae bacterium]|nr:cation diffusion facilitator family transporter [bacterium]
MGRDHDHAKGSDHGKAFAISVALNVVFVVVEVVYGVLSGSVALIADAAHNLSDVLGLVLAWVAMRLAARPPSDLRTYGWRKSTVLAAFLNAVLIMGAVGAVTWEAIGRIGSESPIDGWTMIIVAAVGVVINTASAGLFFIDRKSDANIRGAFLHLAADAAVSVGVVVAGALVLWTGWDWIDPATSLLISAVIVVGTWGLLRDSTNLLLDAVPDDIDLEEVRNQIQSIDSVVGVHDLHVWAMSTREPALTAHVVYEPSASSETVLCAMEEMLHRRFGFEHTTLQVEPEGVASDCKQGRDGNV